LKRRPHFKTCISLQKNKYMVVGPGTWEPKSRFTVFARASTNLTDQATFQVCGTPNKQNLHVCNNENPTPSVDVTSNLRKVSICYAHWKAMVHGPFSFAEATVTSMIYMHIPEMWLWPQPNESHSNNLLFHQDEAPPNFHLDVDASPLDFFFYSDVHKSPMPLPMAELWAQISHTIIAEVDGEMLQHIQDEFQFCIGDISHK
jgi:hypothetical protein